MRTLLYSSHGVSFPTQESVIVSEAYFSGVESTRFFAFAFALRSFLLSWVEVGGGESKDLRLHFVDLSQELRRHDARMNRAESGSFR